MNDESERMWKEVVVAYFKILSWNLIRRADRGKAQKTCPVILSVIFCSFALY
jgi:hypothetical protein